MSTFSLDHLDDTMFEEFSFDLLGDLGFANVSWRKGTGLSSSPADRGRDIECSRVVTDSVDGSVRMEKWFVQCKHYTKGVPPEKLHSACVWASSAQVDVLLFIVSNFLSNPAKDFIDDFRRNHNPRLVIKIWERPDIEKLMVSKVRLLRKYNIPSDVSFVSVMHPAHLMYIKRVPLNSMDYLFDVLDNIDVKKRDSVIGWVYNFVLQPRMREKTESDHSVKDLYIDEVSYEAFKKKCYHLVNSVNERLLVHAIVSFSLGMSFTIADKTSIDDKIENLKDSIEFWQSLLDDDDDSVDDLEDALGPDSFVVTSGVFRDKVKIRSYIELNQKIMSEMPSRVEENYSLYKYFCEYVIDKLLQEKIM